MNSFDSTPPQLSHGWKFLACNYSGDGRISHLIAARVEDGIGVLAEWNWDGEGWSCRMTHTEAAEPLKDSDLDEETGLTHQPPVVHGGGWHV